MRRSLEERFDEKWELAEHPHPTLGTRCWLWTAAKTRGGYGHIHVALGKKRRRLQRAHRVSYERYVGLIPEGLDLDHLCCVPGCVNPQHLEPVTRKENTLRGAIGNDHPNRRKTHCRKGHPFSGDNLVIYKGSTGGKKRGCRACQRACQRAAYRRRVSAEQPVSTP